MPQAISSLIPSSIASFPSPSTVRQIPDKSSTRPPPSGTAFLSQRYPVLPTFHLNHQTSTSAVRRSTSSHYTFYGSQTTIPQLQCAGVIAETYYGTLIRCCTSHPILFRSFFFYQPSKSQRIIYFLGSREADWTPKCWPYQQASTSTIFTAMLSSRPPSNAVRCLDPHLFRSTDHIDIWLNQQMVTECESMRLGRLLPTLAVFSASISICRFLDERTFSLFTQQSQIASTQT